MDVIDQTKGTKNKLNSMTYSTRMIKMDSVGFEPTTSAMQFSDRVMRYWNTYASK
jgi:hypothetical protein